MQPQQRNVSQKLPQFIPECLVEHCYSHIIARKEMPNIVWFGFLYMGFGIGISFRSLLYYHQRSKIFERQAYFFFLKKMQF